MFTPSENSEDRRPCRQSMAELEAPPEGQGTTILEPLLRKPGTKEGVEGMLNRMVQLLEYILEKKLVRKHPIIVQIGQTPCTWH